MAAPSRMPAPMHPAAARLQGDVDVAGMTRRVQEAAAKPPPTPGLASAQAPSPDRVLVARRITFRVDYESPDTGTVESFELVSQVASGSEVAIIARTASAFAQAPLDMLAADDRRYFQALGRAFVQLRDLDERNPKADRVRELLLDPEFLYPIVGRLVEHERRFLLRGRSPSDGATEGSAVRLSPWDAS